jgi:1-aminocyclopropane-1-carboxylate deaminase
MPNFAKMKLLEHKIPIVEIPIKSNVKLFIKREDLTHPEISGNKYWKMFFNVKKYLEKEVSERKIITFGGAFSNHIAAAAALGNEFGIETLGIIRGNELENTWQQNPTLFSAHQNGMSFRFVTREIYKDKEKMMKELQEEFPEALVVPEGGTNENAVEGVQYMLNDETKEFDYLCSAVGTGGTVSGIAKFAASHQKVIGFKAVKDESLEARIKKLSKRDNYTLVDASDGGFGKIIDENVRFINSFYNQFSIVLEPVYTGKMLRKIFEMIDEGYFPENSKILAFHTGGVQGIAGANEMLRKKNRATIDIF